LESGKTCAQSAHRSSLALDKRRPHTGSAMPGASTRPIDADFFLSMESPHRQPALRQTNDGGQMLGFGVELPMTQQAPHKGCCRILPHVYTHQAVPRMTQLASIEA